MQPSNTKQHPDYDLVSAAAGSWVIWCGHCEDSTIVWPTVSDDTERLAHAAANTHYQLTHAIPEGSLL